MTDRLLELARNPFYRKTVQRLGLPLPMPQELRRAKGPWTTQPLSGRRFDLGVASGAELEALIEATLSDAGARRADVGNGAAEARVDVLAFDATGLSGVHDLASVYEFFQPRIKRLARCGRVLVVARFPSRTDHAETTAVRAALDGFVRSVAKEVGRKGSTAHVLYVAEDADERAPALLRFLASDHASFLTGQPWWVTPDVQASDEAPWVRPLEGKVALVTGAARGIGADTARALAAEGASVLCLDRPDDASRTRELASELGGAALDIDVTDADAPQSVIDEVEGRFGGLDILVNNAGITRDKTLGKMSHTQWEQVMAVNLDAVIRLSAALLEDGLRDGGRIVCLSSIAGIAGNFGQTNYAASKAGVAGYVRMLAGKVWGRGITVNAIAPGFIETRLTEAIPVMQREAGRRLSALGQGGLPRDIGDLVTFLASPGAVGLTGQLIRACGGSLVGA